MRTFLTCLRDGTNPDRSVSEGSDWIVVPETILPVTAMSPEGKVMVDELIACLDRDGALADLRPLIILTGRDLTRPGCASLFGYADRARMIGAVSTFRLGKVDPARRQRRLENVIRHELGHLKGLPHCREKSCLMHPATTPEDLDLRSSEPCLRCLRRRPLSTALLHRTAAVLFLILAFAGINLMATLPHPAPMTPFTTLSGSAERLAFNGTPVKYSSSLVDPSVAPGELNRFFMMLESPSLSVTSHGEGEASIGTEGKELLRLRHDEASVEAHRLAARLNELLEAKGSRTSLCAECHLERKPEVLEAAYGRKWGIGPF